jgi:SAM-dependent methyltransferase
MKADNKTIYESGELAARYSAEEKLQPPELSILNSLRTELAQARMLDLGVGGGRTTLHFAPLVRSYVGIDYSEAMVAACRRRFEEAPDRLTFQVADVRSLAAFGAASFDFVLFSYNGLDYVSHEGRREALAEIRRVLRSGGHFALSTHNLNNLRKRLRPEFNLKPRAMASRLLWISRFCWHNRGLNDGKDGYCEVYDGALGYRLRTHYTSPERAVEELMRAGFHDVETFSLATGEAIGQEKNLRANTEDWLYYLCRA